MLFVCVSLVSGRSPHADYIDELIRSESYNYIFPDNTLEDAKLDVPGLIRKYKYPMEVHEVTTSDGYILQMHRIPHGRDQNQVPDPKRPIVFLMHGLLCSSADWVMSGPGSAFGYLLAEEGYDVWMGNARGNYYSRKHISVNPDDIDFWQFSWDEIGDIDLPTMIDYILDHTEREKIYYVGHSQGTTVFFVMCSLHPEYNYKIKAMHAFSPIAFMAHNESPLLKAMASFDNSMKILSALIGVGEVMSNNLFLKWAGESFCKDQAITQAICSNILFYIGGWSDEQLNTTMMPVYFGHTPAGSSVRQFIHYEQGFFTKDFRRYNHGPLKNIVLYGTRLPPKYDLSNILVPVFLYYSNIDPLAAVPDVNRLYKELGSKSKMMILLPSFNHFDYVWGINANTLLYDVVIRLMRFVDAYDNFMRKPYLTEYYKILMG
ncbi:Lipase 3 [Papilio xuthus]|nr:Lipase 3 [Papilio xuthus]